MEITVEQKDPFALVRITGRVVRDNQMQLRSVLDDAVDSGVKGVALDFRNVDYLDSSGMGCCVSVLKHMHDRNSGVLVVFGASSDIERVWKLIRLDVVIPLLGSEEEALSRLRLSAPA